MFCQHIGPDAYLLHGHGAKAKQLKLTIFKFIDLNVITVALYRYLLNFCNCDIFKQNKTKNFQALTAVKKRNGSAHGAGVLGKPQFHSTV